MALFPGLLEQNNPDNPIIESLNSQGGTKFVTSRNDLYAIHRNKLLPGNKAVIYNPADSSITEQLRLSDIDNHGNANGWEDDTAAGGGGINPNIIQLGSRQDLIDNAESVSGGVIELRDNVTYVVHTSFTMNAGERLIQPAQCLLTGTSTGVQIIASPTANQSFITAKAFAPGLSWGLCQVLGLTISTAQGFTTVSGAACIESSFSGGGFYVKDFRAQDWEVGLKSRNSALPGFFHTSDIIQYYVTRVNNFIDFGGVYERLYMERGSIEAVDNGDNLINLPDHNGAGINIRNTLLINILAPYSNNTQSLFNIGSKDNLNTGSIYCTTGNVFFTDFNNFERGETQYSDEFIVRNIGGLADFPSQVAGSKPPLNIGLTGSTSQSLDYSANDSITITSANADNIALTLTVTNGVNNRIVPIKNITGRVVNITLDGQLIRLGAFDFIDTYISGNSLRISTIKDIGPSNAGYLNFLVGASSSVKSYNSLGHKNIVTLTNLESTENTLNLDSFEFQDDFVGNPVIYLHLSSTEGNVRVLMGTYDFVLSPGNYVQLFRLNNNWSPEFIFRGTTVIEALTSIQTTSNSLNLGGNVNLSESASDIKVTTVTNNKQFLVPTYELNDQTGSGPILQKEYGDRVSVVFQPSGADPRTQAVFETPYPFVRNGRGFEYTYYGTSTVDILYSLIYVRPDNSRHEIISRQNVGTFSAPKVITLQQEVVFTIEDDTVGNYLVRLESIDGSDWTLQGDTIDINPGGPADNQWIPRLDAVGQDFVAVLVPNENTIPFWKKPVITQGTSSPPGSGNTNGDRYIIGESPTGAWENRAKQIATYRALTDDWSFEIPQEAWTLYILDEQIIYTYTGTLWLTSAGDQEPYISTACLYDTVAQKYVSKVQHISELQKTFQVQFNAINTKLWTAIVVVAQRQGVTESIATSNLNINVGRSTFDLTFSANDITALSGGTGDIEIQMQTLDAGSAVLDTLNVLCIRIEPVTKIASISTAVQILSLENQLALSNPSGTINWESINNSYVRVSGNIVLSLGVTDSPLNTVFEIQGNDVSFATLSTVVLVGMEFPRDGDILSIRNRDSDNLVLTLIGNIHEVSETRTFVLTNNLELSALTTFDALKALPLGLRLVGNYRGSGSVYFRLRREGDYIRMRLGTSGAYSEALEVTTPVENSFHRVEIDPGESVTSGSINYVFELRAGPLVTDPLLHTIVTQQLTS